MNKTITFLLALVMLLSLGACSFTDNQEEYESISDFPTTINKEEVSETCVDIIKMDPTVDNSHLTIEVLESLSWSELSELAGNLTFAELKNIKCGSFGKLSWTPITDEDIGILTTIRCLNGMGKVFRTTANAFPAFPVENPLFFSKDRFAEKFNIVLDTFNTSADTFWYVHASQQIDINLLTDVVEAVEIRMTSDDDLFIKELKHPVINGCLVVAVDDGYAKSEHPEHYGKASIYSRDGKCGDILEVVDVITITDMTITFDDVEFDMDYDSDTATVYSMLKLSTLDGSDTFYAWATHFIPLNVAEPFFPATDAE